MGAVLRLATGSRGTAAVFITGLVEVGKLLFFLVANKFLIQT